MQNITYILLSTASSLVKWIFLLHKLKDIKSSVKIFHRSAGSDLRNWISYDVTSVQRFLDPSHIATVQHCRTRLKMSIVRFQISCTAAFQGPSSHHLWIALITCESLSPFCWRSLRLARKEIMKKDWEKIWNGFVHNWNILNFLKLKRQSSVFSASSM